MQRLPTVHIIMILRTLPIQVYLQNISLSSVHQLFDKAIAATHYLVNYRKYMLCQQNL